MTPAPGDPEYAGFHVREWWILVGNDPADNNGEEGIMVASYPQAQRFGITPGMCVATDEERAECLRQFARWYKGHYATPDVTFKLMHFTDPEVEVIE